MKKNIQGKSLESLLMSGSGGIGKVDLVHEIGRESYGESRNNHNKGARKMNGIVEVVATNGVTYTFEVDDILDDFLEPRIGQDEHIEDIAKRIEESTYIVLDNRLMKDTPQKPDVILGIYDKYEDREEILDELFSKQDQEQIEQKLLNILVEQKDIASMEELALEYIALSVGAVTTYRMEDFREKVIDVLISQFDKIEGEEMLKSVKPLFSEFDLI